MNEMSVVSFEETFYPMKEVIERCAYFYIDGCNEPIDDIVQDIMLKVLKKWDQLRLLPVNQLKDFVFVITRNHMISAIRRTQRERIYQHHFTRMQTGLLWHDHIIVEEGINVYREAVDLLSPVQKQVFLFYQEGKIHRMELSRTLHKSEHTIKNHLNKANKIVRRYLNRKLQLNICEDGRRKIFRLAELN